MPAHREVEQLVPMESVGRGGVHRQVQAELERGERRDRAPRRQASEILSLSTHTLVAKNSRIIMA